MPWIFNTIDTSSSNARCVDATPLLLYRGRRAVELQVALPWDPTGPTREHFWSYHFTENFEIIIQSQFSSKEKKW